MHVPASKAYGIKEQKLRVPSLPSVCNDGRDKAGSEGEELDRAPAGGPGTPWGRAVWDAELQRVGPHQLLPCHLCAAGLQG